MFSQPLARKILFILAIIGIIVTGYLTIEYLTGGPIVCSITHGCDIVRASKYSHLWGIPISAFGLAMYLFLTGLLIFEVPYSMTLLTIITGLGFAISVYLTYLEVAVILAICTWCVAQAVTVTLMFFTAIATKRKETA